MVQGIRIGGAIIILAIVTDLSILLQLCNPFGSLADCVVDI
jgi:hypothetical protein